MLRQAFQTPNHSRARFEGGDGKRIIREHRTETLDHVIMECGEVQGMEIEIRKKLGLPEDSTGEIVEQTQRILERWERLSYH